MLTYCNDCTSSDVILENLNILAVDKLYDVMLTHQE